MPSSMIHLLAGYKYKPNAKSEFWIGNIAPDTLDVRDFKDRIHFRTEPYRLSSLADYAKSLELGLEFNIGILLHLYLDFKWDEGPMKDFINEYDGENWFVEYRNQIGIASAWLYHNTEWSNHIWTDMAKCAFDISDYDLKVSNENITEYIARNHKYCKENSPLSSGKFSYDVIERFTTDAVDEFSKWINSILC